MAGILTVAPLLILWGSRGAPRWSRRQAFEAGLLAVLLVLTEAAVFGDLLPTGARRYALDFMAVPPLVWAAFRFEQRETATAAFALSAIALWGTLRGLGPFVRENPGEALLVLQAFMGATSLMALLFAALVASSRQSAAAPLLEERLRFETLLSELTAGLIHVPLSGIDAALEAGLRDVVTFLVVDRGDIDEYLGGGLGTRIAWALPGLEAPPRVMEADRFPWATERLLRGEVVRFSRVEELPEAAAVDRASYQRSGTRSKVSLPLQAGGRVLGSLSFGSVRRERFWPDELVERLRLLSEAFASALERKRMDLTLAERLRFEKLLSNLTASFRDLGVIDFDREIRHGLHRMVEFLAADRGSLIEFAPNSRKVRSWALEEWMDVDEFPWLTERLQRGDSVSVSSLDELPDEAAVDRKSYLAYRVKPRLAVPLVVGGTVVGGLVFSAIGAARATSEELMQQLDLLAEVFANALSRRQVELEAQRLRRDLAHIGRISAVGELTASLAHDLSQPLTAILSNAQAARRLLAASPVNLAEFEPDPHRHRRGRQTSGRGDSSIALTAQEGRLRAGLSRSERDRERGGATRPERRGHPERGDEPRAGRRTSEGAWRPRSAPTGGPEPGDERPRCHARAAHRRAEARDPDRRKRREHRRRLRRRLGHRDRGGARGKDLPTAPHDQGRRSGHGPGHRAHDRRGARRRDLRMEPPAGRRDLPFHAANREGRVVVNAEAPRVFLVDDDASVRKSVTRLLSAAGYEVEVFTSALDFLTRPPYAGPCCMVLDVRMPGPSGIDLQTTLAAEGRRMAIVFVTGHIDVPMSVTAMKAGAVDLLIKPVDEEAARSGAIERALAKDARDRSDDAQLGELQQRVAKLTPRERQVFARVVTGMLNKQIAFELGMAEKTVKVHRARVMHKMQAGSVAELVRMADRVGVAGARACSEFRARKPAA